MLILVEIALVLILVGGVVSYATRGRRAAGREAMIERRVDAYMETIRREKAHPELVAMSDTELRDLLLSSAHNLKVQRDRRLYLLFGGVLVGQRGQLFVTRGLSGVVIRLFLDLARPFFDPRGVGIEHGGAIR